MDAQFPSILLQCLRTQPGTWADLDQSAFTRMMTEMGMQCDTVTCFKKIDTKCDGIVTLDELFAFISSGQVLDRYHDRFSKIEWTLDEWSCRHPIMDKEHQTIVEMVNGLIMQMKNGKLSLVQTALTELKNYCETHYTNETKLLRDMGCDQLDHTIVDIHNKTLRIFVDKIIFYESRLRECNIPVICDALNGEMALFLKTWLRSHIRDCERCVVVINAKK